MSSREATLQLSPLHTPKACDILADMLREKIMTGELRHGDPLPAERDLVEKTGISRASVREALRLLEADGLIKTRPGRNGGAVICQPDSSIMHRPIQLLVRGRRIPFRSVLETREAIEPASAGLAATYRTDADIESLEAIGKNLEANIDDLQQYLQNNIDWHVAVVEASHNELLIGVMKALSKTIYAATAVENFNSLDSRHAVAKAHRKVLDAIRAGDADAARRRMSRHVIAYSERVLACAPARIDVQ